MKKFPKLTIKGVAAKALLTPFAALSVIIFYLIRPILVVQVFKVYTHRIGHFTLNTELARLQTLKQNQSGKKILTLYYFPSRTPANSQLDLMWRRELRTISGSWGWLLNHLTKSSKILNSTESSTTIDFHGLLNEFPTILKFTQEELLSSEVRSLGLMESEKFVCLHVRDSAYANQFFGNRDNQSYRNCDINNFTDACDALTNMGYKVFRMGALVEKKLVSKNPSVIDYATNGMRSEFLDIYLGAHCEFTISTASGWDTIPQIFRRPIIRVNALPVCATDNLALESTYIPKVLIDETTGITLSLNEVIDRGVATSYQTQEYAKAGIQIRELNKQELVEAVTEMAARVEGKYVENSGESKLNEKLSKILTTHSKLQPSPNFFPIRAHFGLSFLARYQNYLD